MKTLHRRTPRTSFLWWVSVVALSCGCNMYLDRDQDGDGFPSRHDCNDADATINPAQVEVEDGLDNNCDGQIDEGFDEGTPDTFFTFYQDQDQDGYGNPNKSLEAGAAPAGYVENGDDCNDMDEFIHPEAVEICDGADNNCDATVDSDAVDRETYYEDLDGDGYGDPAYTIKACSEPEGYAETADDCDDNDANIHPGIDEPGPTSLCDGVDNDCDGSVDEGYDLDDDGIPDCQGIEVCDGLDNNANGQIDEGFDADGDGYTGSSCECRAGAVSTCGLDCNDEDPDINPEAEELCDPADVDEDCNGLADNADPGSSNDTRRRYYIDADQDGFGDVDDPGTLYCDDPSTSQTFFVTNNGDCDDVDAGRNPGISEICDARDNDCDRIVDEGLSYYDFYKDKDGDGFGGDPFYEKRCAPPAGYVDNDLDCDDSNPSISPESPEVCDTNSTDEDCDGLVDDEDPDVYEDLPDGASGYDKLLYYSDDDRDGFGDHDDPGTPFCRDRSTQDESRVMNNMDCNDDNEMTYFGAPELCDYEDNDCDGLIDNDVVYYLFFPDEDGDGYGNMDGPGSLACTYPEGENTVLYEIETTDVDGDGRPDEFVLEFDTSEKDCDDSPPSIAASEVACGSAPPPGESYGGACVNPGETEVCDGIDQDCDGQIDEGCP